MFLHHNRKKKKKKKKKKERKIMLGDTIEFEVLSLDVLIS